MSQTFHAKINVSLKPGVLDPQGKATLHGLTALGFETVQGVRVGKSIVLTFSAPSEEKAKELVQQMGEKLLANTVIENFEFEVEKI